LKPGFIDGFTFWIRGWNFLLRHKSLVALAIVPFLISITIAGLTMSYLFSHLPLWVHGLMDYMLAGAPEFLKYLYYPLLLGTGVLVIIAGIFVAYLGQAIIALPFYALLAERALSVQGALVEEPFEFGRWLRSSARMLRISLMKSALFLFLGLCLFLLSFIPVVNVAAVFGTLLILSFDQLDYSFEAMRFGFRRRLGHMGSHKRMWCGMAAGLGLTLLVPGLTLIVAPGAVVGAAILLKESAGYGSTAAT
jgi:CysZ protein